jgi:hypothetical protein
MLTDMEHWDITVQEPQQTQTAVAARPLSMPYLQRNTTQTAQLEQKLLVISRLTQQFAAKYTPTQQALTEAATSFYALTVAALTLVQAYLMQ